jgi:uncharacterized protein
MTRHQPRQAVGQARVRSANVWLEVHPGRRRRLGQRVAVSFRCRGILLVLLMGWILFSGCGQSSSEATRQGLVVEPKVTSAQPRLRTMKVWLGAHELTTEVALTAQERETGMMFRTNIAEDEAMLFVFPRPGQVAFWMKNVPIPLSCAYIDPEGMILELHDLEPHNEESVRASSFRIQYVLETAQSWFERKGVGTGTVVRTERGSLPETFGTGGR